MLPCRLINLSANWTDSSSIKITSILKKLLEQAMITHLYYHMNFTKWIRIIFIYIYSTKNVELKHKLFDIGNKINLRV